MMKAARWSLFMIVLLLFGCSTLNDKGAQEPSTGNILKSTDSERIYRADYDRTFRASVDTLRQLDEGSAKLVRYNEGLIVFQGPRDSGVVNVNVSKVDSQTTRVVLSATKTRKYWFDESDEKIKNKFFEELDSLLAAVSPSQPAVKETKTSDNAPPATETEQKDAVAAKLAAHLQLGENEVFLQKLSYDELRILEQKLESLEISAGKQTELSSRCAACYVDLARVYHDSGRYARSAEALKTAIAVDPNNAVAHCNLGEVYKHLNLVEDALRELNAAQSLNPQLPDVYINLGILYDDYINDKQKALENYRQYLTVGGSDQQVTGWITAIEKGS